MALSYELLSFFRAGFLTLVLLKMDLGSEFCGPTPKKQRQWREVLGVLPGFDPGLLYGSEVAGTRTKDRYPYFLSHLPKGFRGGVKG